MEFIAPEIAPDCSQPSFEYPSSPEAVEAWAMQWIRFIGTHYNRPFPTWNPDATTENYLPVEKGILNSLYYLGKQRNINYHHVTQDMNGNALPVTWVKNKKVKPLVDRLTGDVIKQLGAKEISATSLSKRAKSEKMRLYEEVMLQFDSRIKNKLDEMEQKFGVKYVPPLSDKYNSQEEAEAYLTHSFKDDLEETATFLGRYIEENTKFDTSFIEGFRQDLAPANWMAIIYYVENGVIKSKRVPFYNLIWDIKSDDPFVRDGQFVAVIERLNIQEILKRWPSLRNDPDVMTKLNTILNDDTYRNGFFNYYNQGGLEWWIDRRNEISAACVTGYWICQRNSGVEKIQDKYGTKKYVKSVKKGEIIYDLYTATMVGNCYLVNSQFDDNVVRSVYNKADIEMPVKILNLNNILGEGVSLIGMVTDLIDLMDALDFKIREMIGKHKGKGYIINGSRLATTSKDFVQNMSTLGVEVVYPSGEGAPSDNMPPVYPIDMTLDDSIIKYSNYWYELERRCESYLNLNPSSLGQQSTQIGLGVQKNNIAMSTTGNMYLYRQLFEFNQICLQYSINLAKIVYGRNPHDSIASLVVGDRGLKVIEILKKNLFEDVLIKISPKDVITDEIKARILAMAQAFAQNDRISPMDYIKMEMAETMSEVINDFEKSELRREKAAQEQAAMADQSKMQHIMASNQGQMAVVQSQAQAQAERNTQNNQTKIMLEDMRNDKRQQ